MKIINWFQIPVTDMERAARFYSMVTGASFHRMENEMGKHAFFAMDTLGTDKTGGELVQSAEAKPSREGALVYFQAPAGLDTALSRVQAAGGQVLMPKTSIGENGVIAIVLDTEGNRIGLHSM